MSAEVETMAYAGEMPWHGLGVQVEPDLTPDEILEAAGLNWKVVKVPMFYDHEGSRKQSSRLALVRETDGSELTIVSGKWAPIQNHQAFSIFNEFVQEGGMQMETAGSLFDGQIVWALAKTTEAFRVFGDDEIRGYFLFSNPHIYGKTATFGGTSIRVVCNNTHSWALQSGLDNRVVINHRAAFDAAAVHDSLAALHIRLGEFKERAELLGGRRYDDETLAEYFNEVFPVTGAAKNKKASLNAKRALRIVEEQPGAEFAAGTWWNAYNAVSYVTDHLAGNGNDNRINSAWFGKHRNLKNTALDLATDYAMAA